MATKPSTAKSSRVGIERSSEVMKNQFSLQCLLALLGAITVSGCAVSTGEEVGVAEEAALTSNALTSNALTSNALTSNALTSNALTSNALTSNALTSNALTSNALTSNALKDPNAQEVMKYIVSCALPASARVVTPEQTYEGELGLAPEWGAPGGHCNKDCVEWVSACVLARVDFLGEHVEISIRGDNPALATSKAEQTAYPDREATYFGNIFAAEQQRFACLPPGATSDTRVCGPSLTGCVMSFTKPCDWVCDPPSADGAYRNCSAPLGDVGLLEDLGGFRSITVYLQ
jgi:hypothetical protein